MILIRVNCKFYDSYGRCTNINRTKKFIFWKYIPSCVIYDKKWEGSINFNCEFRSKYTKPLPPLSPPKTV